MSGHLYALSGLSRTFPCSRSWRGDCTRKKEDISACIFFPFSTQTFFPLSFSPYPRKIFVLTKRNPMRMYTHRYSYSSLATVTAKCKSFTPLFFLCLIFLFFSLACFAALRLLRLRSFLGRRRRRRLLKPGRLEGS